MSTIEKKDVKKVEKRAKKILEYIDNKNYSQEELLSFNYEPLINFTHRKLFKKNIIDDEIYLILQMIIRHCTSLDEEKFVLLYSTDEKSTEYKELFNVEMAHYFDESIIL